MIDIVKSIFEDNIAVMTVLFLKLTYMEILNIIFVKNDELEECFVSLLIRDYLLFTFDIDRF